MWERGKRISPPWQLHMHICRLIGCTWLYMVAPGCTGLYTGKMVGDLQMRLRGEKCIAVERLEGWFPPTIHTFCTVQSIHTFASKMLGGMVGEVVWWEIAQGRALVG